VKAFFILSHPSSKLHGEVREALVARELRQLGVDARIFRVWGGDYVMSEIFQDAVPVNYYPADLPINEVHETKSHSLVKRVVAEQPDLIIFKGIDYDLVQFVIDQIDLEITKIGFIIGGASSGIILNYASFVVTESERQSEVVRGQVHPQVPVKVLAKYINWGVIDKFDGALKPPIL
jgi:hypothetical protein